MIPVSLDEALVRLAFRLSTAQVYLIKKRRRFLLINLVHQHSHIGCTCCFFPAILMSLARLRIRIILVGDKRTDIPRLVFSPIHFAVKYFRIVFPITGLQEGVGRNSFPNETTGSSMFCILLAIYTVVDTTLNISAILERLPELILRHLLVLCIQVLWQ